MPKPTYIITDGNLTLTLHDYDESSGYWCVGSPFIPELVTQARDIDEAFAMARDWIACMKSEQALENETDGGW